VTPAVQRPRRVDPDRVRTIPIKNETLEQIGTAWLAEIRARAEAGR
jgi:hypothetical protein